MAHQIYNTSQSLGSVARGSSSLGYGGSRGYDNPMYSRENGGGAFDPAGFPSRESRYFPADPKTHTIEPDNTGGLSLTSERYFDRLPLERPQVEAGGRFSSLGMDRYLPSEVGTQRLESSRYYPGPNSSLLLNGGDSSLFRGSDAAAGYGLSSTYYSGRSLVSPPLQQTVWPGADPRAPVGVVAGVKRPNEEVSNQQTLGAHNKFGQNEAFLSLNALAKRPRLDTSSDLPIYPQRPGEKDCAHYMITRTCKFGAECKFDHPTWVPAGGIPDWKEVSSVALSSGPPPERPGETECPYFMKTGICKFGAKCKFHHPKDRLETSKSSEQKADGSEVKSADSNGDQLPNRPGEPECDYFMKTGNCKFGAKCKYDHPKDKQESVNASDKKVEVDAVLTGGKEESGVTGAADGKAEKKFTPVKPAIGQNSKGLPIRPAETDCPFYVKTGSCKYGANCRFNHPERTVNPPSTVMPFITQNQPLVGYPGILPQHPLGVNIPPQRPGQPECTFYMKTGECKFGPSCKFNHPLNRQEPPAKLTLAGLPRREGESICSFYLKTGICKFGANCKFDHPPPGELDAAHAQPSVKLTLAGYPRREGELTCEFYMKTGTCKYGATCKYDHPPPGEAVAKAVAKASTNGNTSNDENELDTDLVKAGVQDTNEDAQDEEDEQNLL